MSEYTQTNSGIIVPKQPKRKPTVTLVPCGYCPKQIMCESEPEGRPHVHKGKPMCRVCCVTKKGKLKNAIKANQSAAEQDVRDLEEAKREDERKRLLGISAESNSRTLKNLLE